MGTNFLVIQPNLLNHALTLKIKQDLGRQIWNHQNAIAELQDEIIDFYAKMFTNSDKQKARNIIEVTGIGLMRRRDLIMISFFAGTILILVPINSFLILYDFPEND